MIACFRAYSVRNKPTMVSLKESGGTPIVVKINDDRKLVSIWLTGDDPEWSDFPEDVKQTSAHYRKKRYMVATFRTGSEDMYDNTYSLLKYNRRLTAEKEVQEMKAASAKKEV